jgi:hypothetical protein
MKITHTVLEGTPEELQRLSEWPQIAMSLTQTSAARDIATPQSIDTNRITLPSALDEFIAKRGSRNPGRELLRELADHFLSSGRATWKIGTSGNSEDGQTPYFSLYAPGPQRVGSAAYIHPVNGRVTVRLAWEDSGVTDELRGQAFRASEQAGNTYGVGVMVTSPSSYDAAVALITLAIKRALQA